MQQFLNSAVDAMTDGNGNDMSYSNVIESTSADLSPNMRETCFTPLGAVLFGL